MCIKGIPNNFYVEYLIWILIIYNIAYRWYLINSELYFVLEFFIYLFSMTNLIMGVVWGIQYKAIKTWKFLILNISILLATVITFFHFADTAKLYIDFAVNYQERKEIAEKLIIEYSEKLKTKEYYASTIHLSEEHKKLSADGVVHIWLDREYIKSEVDFKVFDGGIHSYVDFFNYGKSGHISYVTEIEKYNLKGGPIQEDIISTKKIYGNWYFSLTKY